MYPAIYSTAKEWSYVQTARTVQHVLPNFDTREHEVHVSCFCKPGMVCYVDDSGTVWWTVDHHSLDRREEE